MSTYTESGHRLPVVVSIELGHEIRESQAQNSEEKIHLCLMRQNYGVEDLEFNVLTSQAEAIREQENAVKRRSQFRVV